MKDFKSVIVNKKFVYLWISQIFSQYAINILNFLFLFKIYQQTNSPIAVSILWIVYSIPALLIGPFSSTLIDLTDKRSVLIFSNLLQALILFLYSIVYIRNYYFIYVAAFCYSLLNQFYVPSESSSIPNLVKRDQLSHANSLFFFTQQSAVIFGYGLSGIVNQFIGFQNTVFICSIMLFLAFLSVMRLPGMRSRIELGRKFDDMVDKFIKNLKQGYEMIRNEKNILLPICLLLFGQSAVVIVTINTPFIAEQILKVNPIFSGILIVIPASVGAITSSIYTSKRLKNGERKKKLILRSLFSLAILLLVINFIALFQNVLLRLFFGIIIIFFIGSFFIQIIIPSQTFLQESTPNNFRGRVFGNYWVLSTLISFIPILITATFSEFFGIRFITIMLSIICMLVFYFSKKDTHSKLYA